MENKKINEDVILPKRDDDGELHLNKDDDGELRPPIPSDISDVGDAMRAKYQEKASELLSKLEKEFGTTEKK